ncbi:MAG: hypothetical protein AAGD25_20940 [Cyanobacteria bacterium P01_F01_bin.150]
MYQTLSGSDYYDRSATQQSLQPQLAQSPRNRPSYQDQLLRFLRSHSDTNSV